MRRQTPADMTPHSGMAQKKKQASKNQRVALSKAERKILLKACKQYRTSIPVYLKACQAEVLVVDAVLRKLS